MRTCLNQLTMNNMTSFISQANAGIRPVLFRRLTQEFALASMYGQDLEKMEVNGPEKRKLGRGRNYDTD